MIEIEFDDFYTWDELERFSHSESKSEKKESLNESLKIATKPP